MKRLRWLPILFGLFVLLVVISADQGWGYSFFALIYRIPYADKVGHFFLMGFLSFLASLAFPGSRLGNARFPIRPLKSSLILLVLVGLEEISQNFFPNRTPDLMDYLASLAGILLFGELGAFIHQKRLEQPQSSKPSISRSVPR